MSGTPLTWRRPRLCTPLSRERLRQPFRSPLLSHQRGGSTPTPSATPPTSHGPASADTTAGHSPASSSDSLNASPSFISVSPLAADASSAPSAVDCDEGASPTLRSASGAEPELRLALAAADEELARLEAAGCRTEQLPRYIAALHDYNEIKDAAQLVMGRIAELDGVTVRAVHARYDVLPSAEQG